MAIRSPSARAWWTKILGKDRQCSAIAGKGRLPGDADPAVSLVTAALVSNRPPLLPDPGELRASDGRPLCQGPSLFQFRSTEKRSNGSHTKALSGVVRTPDVDYHRETLDQNPARL